MNTQVNWKKIRNEFQRLADVDQLKSEVQRIGGELRKFDLNTVLSPKAQARVKVFEKRYAELMRTLQTAQRQMDREVNRILRQIKVHRADVNSVVNQQKNKLEKVSRDFKKRFTAKMAYARTASSKAKKTGTKARTSKKTAGRKRK